MAKKSNKTYYTVTQRDAGSGVFVDRKIVGSATRSMSEGAFAKATKKADGVFREVIGGVPAGWTLKTIRRAAGRVKGQDGSLIHQEELQKGGGSPRDPARNAYTGRDDARDRQQR